MTEGGMELGILHGTTLGDVAESWDLISYYYLYIKKAKTTNVFLHKLEFPLNH